MSQTRNKKPQSFRLNQSVLGLLDKMSEETGMSKTAIMEKALIDFHRRYDKDLEMDIREQIDEIHDIVKKFTVVGIPQSIDKINTKK